MNVLNLFFSSPVSRMSPTEFSNYIKQRAIQQQNHHSHNGPTAVTPVICGAAPASVPATDRSLSPNPLSVALINGTTTTNTNSMPTRANLPNDSYFYSKTASAGSGGAANINATPVAAVSMYSPPPPAQFGRSNLFDVNNSFVNVPPQNPINPIATNSSFYSNGYGSVGNSVVTAAATTPPIGKYSPYIDTNNYYGMSNGQQQQSANKLNSLGAPASHINGMTNGHHQTLESNLNTGNINLLVAN